MTRGWKRDSARHALAAKGIKMSSLQARSTRSITIPRGKARPRDLSDAEYRGIAQDIDRGISPISAIKEWTGCTDQEAEYYARRYDLDNKRG